MSITLLAASNVNHELTEFALNTTIHHHKFDEVVVLSDKQLNISTGYYHCNIDEKFNLNDLSHFLVKDMVNLINTEHVLVVQYDGMAVNGERWSDDFLEYDYIGPPTPTSHPPIEHLRQVGRFAALESQSFPQWFVGGGGFSLRSKKLLNALKDPHILSYAHYKDLLTGEDRVYTCEDLTICIEYKDFLVKEYGIKFAPIEVALRFGAEVLTGYNSCLGFHGFHNIPLFFDEQTCIYYMSKLKKKSFDFGSAETNLLLGNLYAMAYYQAVEALYEIHPKLKTMDPKYR